MFFQIKGKRVEFERSVQQAHRRLKTGFFRWLTTNRPQNLLTGPLIYGMVIPLLMLGGAYLCFEGFEKLAHSLLHSPARDESHHTQLVEALVDFEVDLVAFERDKIVGAVRTDFVLSAEIIVITLGTVAGQPLASQAAVLAAIGVIMTVGVYGLVAGIVKIDDLGLYLTRRPSAKPEGGFTQALGRGLLRAAPVLMKVLSVAGTAAMFLVGGGILVHGLPFLHHLLEGLPLGFVWDGLVGIVAGALVLAGVTLVQRLRQGSKGN